MAWLRRKPRALSGEVLPPETAREEIDRLAEEIIALHNEVYHLGRICCWDERERCDAVTWSREDRS